MVRNPNLPRQGLTVANDAPFGREHLTMVKDAGFDRVAQEYEQV